MVDFSKIHGMAVVAARQAVVNDDVATGQNWFPCGRAYVTFDDGRDPYVNYLRKAGVGRKGTYRGWEIYCVGGDVYNGQKLSSYEAGAMAYVKVLAAHGIRASTRTWVD